MINVTLLGTGGMLPLPDRWLTSLWVEYNGKACLIDCGEGTQIAIREQGIKLSHLDTILLTHVHADHISGLPGLLLSVGNSGRTESVTIYGHIGISETINKLLCISTMLPFEIEIHELPVDSCGKFMWNDMVISSLPLDHRITCLGYSFLLKRKPVFAPEMAKKLGIDVKFWKELHSGKSVTVGDKTYTPDMVTSALRDPLKLTYMTDTRYFGEMEEFAKNSDLLITEGMYGSDEYIEKMREKRHMVFSQAARLAAASHSKELWLTHYSPALTDPKEYTEYIRGIFKKTTVSSDGEHTVLK